MLRSTHRFSLRSTILTVLNSLPAALILAAPLGSYSLEANSAQRAAPLALQSALTDHVARDSEQGPARARPVPTKLPTAATAKPKRDFLTPLLMWRATWSRSTTFNSISSSQSGGGPNNSGGQGSGGPINSGGGLPYLQIPMNVRPISIYLP